MLSNRVVGISCTMRLSSPFTAEGPESIDAGKIHLPYVRVVDTAMRHPTAKPS